MIKSQPLNTREYWYLHKNKSTKENLIYLYLLNWNKTLCYFRVGLTSASNENNLQHIALFLRKLKKVLLFPDQNKKRKRKLSYSKFKHISHIINLNDLKIIVPFQIGKILFSHKYFLKLPTKIMGLNKIQ